MDTKDVLDEKKLMNRLESEEKLNTYYDEIPHNVALYAVRPVSPLPPPLPLGIAVRPGAPISDINITYSQLEENIGLLKSTISTLKNSWNDGTKKNLSTLENSWVGEDCIEYTSKLRKMDKKVQNTISALELLCEAYEKTRDMLKDSQRNIVSSINNIG